MLSLEKATWSGPIHRLIPSRFPPVNLFEFARDEEEFQAMCILEGYTNDRLRDELGLISQVPPAQRRFGPGYSSIMAAFTHIGFASRFTDGRYGVYYGAESIEVALDEVSYHRARLMAASAERPTRITLRQYQTTAVEGVDFGLLGVDSHPECLDPDPAGYGPAQALGAQWRAQQEYGLLYPSVRADSGQCLAILRPDALNPATEGAHFALIWDGERIAERYAAQPV